MACPKYSTEMAERKKGQHLRMEERGAIKALEKQGLGAVSYTHLSKAIYGRF